MNGDSINLVQPRQKPVHDYNKALIDFLSQPNTIISVENYQGFCPKLRRQFDAGTPIFWFVFFSYVRMGNIFGIFSTIFCLSSTRKAWGIFATRRDRPSVNPRDGFPPRDGLGLIAVVSQYLARKCK